MSRIIVLIIGFIAGWFLKDSNWKEWLKNLKTPKQPPQKPISLLENKVTKPAPATGEVFADALEQLTGIGPASKAKLNEQGIYTFSQVAKLKPEKLKEIAGARVKAEEVIQQAKSLAG